MAQLYYLMILLKIKNKKIGRIIIKKFWCQNMVKLVKNSKMVKNYN